ncbi:MAG TPA: 16S rRNA (cytosine(1402)-N(4))-methyltransferase [Firmicutes bacterium]|nr:16S rRNA (cytosine(1402)-N(4))-methyltransferase [Bacillota bacterium]
MSSTENGSMRQTVGATQTWTHIPVMGMQVLDAAKGLADPRVLVDMTLGRAGHSSLLLSSFPDLFLYGFDRDAEAISQSSEKLQAEFPDRFKLFRTDFANAVPTLKNEGLSGADFILFDTGVSSPQFDDPSRGFSYRFDAPLDMRMDQSQALTAKTVVNEYSQEELERILKNYGGERFYRPIARSIVRFREVRPLETTFDLVNAVKAALPERILRKEGHPAKQTFMAIRFEVNNEREEMERAITDAVRFLNAGGRCCVITFNSDDDQQVKRIFESFCPRREISRFFPPLPAVASEYEILTHKALVADANERAINPRSEPARMRIIQRRSK